MSELWISRFIPPRAGETLVSCVVCGCRLMPADAAEPSAWRHLPSLEQGRDARGDRPHCVDALHDSYGYALTEAPTSASAA